MSLVLDAGALVATTLRSDLSIALLKRELLAGRAPLTHGGAVGQVWRGGSGRQANLARLLRGVEVRALVGALGDWPANFWASRAKPTSSMQRSHCSPWTGTSS